MGYLCLGLRWISRRGKSSFRLIVKLCYIGKSPEWAYVIFLMFQKEIPQLGNVHKLANKKIIIYLYY